MIEYKPTAIGDMLINEAAVTKMDETCLVQKFMEQEALNRSGAQVNKPLFISCPCKRCSPFTL